MRAVKLFSAILALFLFGLFGGSPAWADGEPHPYACVLNFDRINLHPFVDQLAKQFDGMKGVRLIKSARPSDILSCLDDGAVTVTVLTHKKR